MPGLRVLLTNNSLRARAGTETFVRDLAKALLRRGHHPVVYSADTGVVADDLRRATVPMLTDLGALGEAPDVIHGQHHLETMTACLHFPAVPALYVCHGWLPWEEAPPVFPSIRRYVAVDDLCRERLVTTAGVSPDRVQTIYNAVDLSRFRPRTPLPPKPTSAIVFSNYAREDAAVAAIRRACAARGIMRVDVVGHGTGTSVDSPEELLGRYDIVFAKARCALEAMAAGCAVVVVDFAGLAGYVTPAAARAWRPLNFGVRTMQAERLTEGTVGRAIDHYDPAASAAVRDWIRADADFERSVDAFEAVYAGLIAEASPWLHATALEFSRAASAYLATLTPILKGRHDAERQRDQLASDLNDTTLALGATTGRLGEATSNLAQAAQSLDEIQNSKAWRLISRYRDLRRRWGI